MNKNLTNILKGTLIVLLISILLICSINAKQPNIYTLNSDTELSDKISIVYENENGTEYFEPQNLAAPEVWLFETEDKKYSANVDFDSMNGAFIFKGWYENEAFKSSNMEYIFETQNISSINLTAKFIITNVISGAAGFESFENNTNLRVSPANAGVLPSDGKYGVYHNTKYESDTTETKRAEVLSGDYKNTYISSISYTPQKGSTSITQAVETVKPHSGNSMLGLSYTWHTLIRKLDNLKANTNYTVSFYVYNPDKWDFLYRAVVANTCDLNATTVNLTSNYIYGYYEAETYEEFYGQNTELINNNEIKKWHKIDINFTTGDDTSNVYLHFAPKQIYSKAVYTTFIDDLVCYETIFNTVGNSIRAANSTTSQALRYKFTIDNEKLKTLAGYNTSEIGLLAIKSNNLNNEELVLNGEYTSSFGTHSPIKKLVDTNKNLQYVDGDTENTYFTGTLYNIGVKNGDTDYTMYGEEFTVRPYITYASNTDGSAFTVYGNEISSSIFDVMYAVKEARRSEDLTVVDTLLKTKGISTAYNSWLSRDGWFSEKEPVADYAYSMAVVGDIQITTLLHPEDLHYTYDWIVNNKEAKNIQHVIGLGDITHRSTQTEYNNIKTQLKRLNNAKIPQTIIRGNHDTEKTFNANITQKEYGACLGGEFGSYDSTMRNTYRILTINGIKYMMLTLDYFPSNDEVAWACNVVKNNPDCNVIVSTHGYFDTDMTYLQDDEIYDAEPPATSGQYIYDTLISKYQNIVMVLCGHEYVHGPTVRMATGKHGNEIVQIMINPQRREDLEKRAYGMLAMFYFSNDGKTVSVEYFSTITGDYYKEKNQFTFELNVIK